MFLLQTKTIFVEAIEQAFDGDHPVEEFQNLHISMEYPVEESQFPAVWVDFTPTADLQIAGIGHVEDIELPDGNFKRGTRWRFGGHVTYTVSALSSRERDRITDEVIRVVAFGGEYPMLSRFRQILEVNDLIQVSMQWDTFSIAGKDEAPGTPWGTDEIVYEITVGIDCQGSFVSGSDFAQPLIPLSQVVVKEYIAGEPPPEFETSPAGGTPPPRPWQ